MLRQLWNDECGFVISAELILVLTIGVLAMVVGLSEVAVAVNTELNDLSNAFGSLKQDYAYTGFFAKEAGKEKSFFNGAGFKDKTDENNAGITIRVGKFLKGVSYLVRDILLGSNHSILLNHNVLFMRTVSHLVL